VLVSFFFSSRRRHTRSYGDWSSDVCSSDLALFGVTRGHPSVYSPELKRELDRPRDLRHMGPRRPLHSPPAGSAGTATFVQMNVRSEERRVGKEGRYRW